MRILFIVNPGSGTGFPDRLTDDFGSITRTHGHSYKIIHLGGKDPSFEIEKTFQEEEIDLAVAAGGDGTVNMVAGLIRDREIRLGIIPLGSSNGLAYQLGLPTDPMKALERIFDGQERQLDVIRINQSYDCLHLCDMGMNARVIKRYEKDGIRGLYGYARQYFKEFGRTKRFHCTVETDQVNFSCHPVMVVLANGSYYGTGAHINPSGKPDDGRFEVILVYGYPLKFLWVMFLSLIFRRKKEPEGLIDTLPAEHAKITARKAQDVQVDGEPAGKVSRLEAEVLPGSIRIIC